jgi:hypothetical protein
MLYNVFLLVLLDNQYTEFHGLSCERLLASMSQRVKKPGRLYESQGTKKGTLSSSSRIMIYMIVVSEASCLRMSFCVCFREASS